MTKFLLFLIILCFACSQSTPREYNTQESAQIAQMFLRNAPTFGSHGNDLELIQSVPIDCESCIMHIFTFSRSYAGYGQISNLQIETAHTATVVVQKNKIVSATIDQQWDELHNIALT